MQAKLKEYADLLIRVGLNVQKGQTVVIMAPVDVAPFVRQCAEAAYGAGCREVIVEWNDDTMARLRFLHADSTVFDTCPSWLADKYNLFAREGAAFLNILADDPDALAGIDPDRLQRSAKSRGEALKPFQDATIRGEATWCVAALPVPAWAAKVFPEKSEAESMAALWDAIFATLRLTGDGESTARWQEHAEKSAARSKRLNEMDLKSLHYKNSLGTDLTVELPEGALWVGGAEKGPGGLAFMPNLPTEELFTVPRRDGVNGVAVSSMPFSLYGNVIDQFRFTFKDGKIVDVQTEKDSDKELLEKAISVDEGAAFLGEAALVPYDSPIRNLGILFYNTLFDENAACHLAFGRAYPCLEGAAEMTQEELTARGINESVTHQDFMIGTADLSITGLTRDGREVPIFTNGNYAF